MKIDVYNRKRSGHDTRNLWGHILPDAAEELIAVLVMLGAHDLLREDDHPCGSGPFQLKFLLGFRDFLDYEGNGGEFELISFCQGEQHEVWVEHLEQFAKHFKINLTIEDHRREE